MRLLSNLLSLPTSLLLLISAAPWTTSAEADPQQLYNVAAGTPYRSDDEAHVRRALAVKELLASKVPVGMRKMSDDPDEMFFLDYWEFDTGLFESNLASDRGQSHLKRAVPARYANESASDFLLPPLRPHGLGDIREAQNALSFFRRNSLSPRDFTCPENTSNCASIKAPDSCCATGDTCVKVQNTGNGVVGCCPPGDTCGDTIGNCDVDAGYKNCPDTPNGGCCIPNFDCLGVGCKCSAFTRLTFLIAISL
jgi:progranulin